MEAIRAFCSCGIQTATRKLRWSGAEEISPVFFVHFKTNWGFKLKTLLKMDFYGSAI